MALRISYKPGEKQSQLAASYFRDAMDGLVCSMIDGLVERTHHIQQGHGPYLQLRIWSAEELEQEDLNELFEWLLTLRGDILSLQDTPGTGEGIANLVTNWLSVRLGGVDLLAELSIVHPETGVVEMPEFTLGMVRGRSVMVSTHHLFFCWLQEDIFGLSLAGHGSFLLEVLEGDGNARRSWRQAS